MMHYLTDPFHYAFIQRAALAGMLIGVLCACWGSFVVLRRMSLIGHALSHSALPGLVIAFLFGWNLLFGAFAAILVTAMLIGVLSRDNTINEDTSGGIIPNVMFALGILLISTTKSFRDLFSMLFGNILAVSAMDLTCIVLITIVALAVLFLLYKELKLFCVDPQYARAIGIPVDRLRYTILIFLALTVVVGIQAVGTVLTNALLVIPVAAARILTDRLSVMMILSSVFAVIAALGGVYASYYFGFSSGAAIVMVCAIIFGIAWVYQFIRRSVK